MTSVMEQHFVSAQERQSITEIIRSSFIHECPERKEHRL